MVYTDTMILQYVYSQYDSAWLVYNTIVMVTKYKINETAIIVGNLGWL